jgi:hypothetical protein
MRAVEGFTVTAQRGGATTLHPTVVDPSTALASPLRGSAAGGHANASVHLPPGSPTPQRYVPPQPWSNPGHSALNGSGYGPGYGVGVTALNGSSFHNASLPPSHNRDLNASQYAHNSQQHQQPPLSTRVRFVKSTYNDNVTFSNHGLTATHDETMQWETAMCEGRLGGGGGDGVVYVEVAVERHHTGCSTVVGIVFDGPHELCEVLGEDNNSVGFNSVAGTKCCAGDLRQTYSAPATQLYDTVGMRLDYGQRCIEYFRNGQSLGVAFTGLEAPCFVAVSMLGPQQVTLGFPLDKR